MPCRRWHDSHPCRCGTVRGRPCGCAGSAPRRGTRCRPSRRARLALHPEAARRRRLLAAAEPLLREQRDAAERQHGEQARQRQEDSGPPPSRFRFPLSAPVLSHHRRPSLETGKTIPRIPLPVATLSGSPDQTRSAGPEAARSAGEQRGGFGPEIGEAGLDAIPVGAEGENAGAQHVAAVEDRRREVDPVARVDAGEQLAVERVERLPFDPGRMEPEGEERELRFGDEPKGGVAASRRRASGRGQFSSSASRNGAMPSTGRQPEPQAAVRAGEAGRDQVEVDEVRLLLRGGR